MTDLTQHALLAVVQDSTLEWATFIAAAVTAVAALIAVAYTATTHRRAVNVERRAQASRIAVWPLDFKHSRSAAFVGYDSVEAVVHNGSDQPVSAIRVELVPVDWTHRSEAVFAHAVGVLRPQSDSLPLSLPGLEGDIRVDQDVAMPPPLRLVFRDNAGVAWVRHPDGRLVGLKQKR